MPSAAGRASTARGGGRGRGRQGAGHGEEHENSERWLVTYADLLTVLLALFIVLFAISALNQSKFVQLKYSLAAVFGDGSIGVLDGSPALNDSNANDVAQPPTVPEVPVTTDAAEAAVPNLGGWLDGKQGADSGKSGQGAADKVGADGKAAQTKTASGLVIDTGDKKLDSAIKLELDNFAAIQAEIDAHLAKAGMSGAVNFAIDQRGLIITVVTDALVFPGNSATLLPKGQALLAAIAPAVAKVANNVEVDGFTNQVDVSTYPYPSGWELSSARASSVVRYLENHGLGNRQLSAVGFSDQRPLVPPSNPLSVTRNRRVEIVVLSSLPAVAGNALLAAGNAAKAAASSSASPAPTSAASHTAAGTAPVASATSAAPSAARGNQARSTVPATTGAAAPPSK
jgi:chemotaxis protein MotB